MLVREGASWTAKLSSSCAIESATEIVSPCPMLSHTEPRSLVRVRVRVRVRARVRVRVKVRVRVRVGGSGWGWGWG